MKRHGMLSGKICFVTGAGRGIGRSIVERFSQEGATVYANSLPSDPIEPWADDWMRANDAAIVPMYFDIADASAVKDALMQIKKSEGRLDVVVNNAGIMSNERIGMIRKESVRKLFEVNVFALIEILQMSARVMARQDGGGSIINISSIVGQRGNPGQLTYAATKGAVISITKTAAKELAEKSIRVNAIAPGLTDTPGMQEADSKFLTERISNIGMGRLAQPVDIANACLFLASDLSAYVSGEIIGVNGCAVM